MTQQPAKRIPQWLTIDVLVIVISLAIIGIGIGIGIVPGDEPEPPRRDSERVTQDARQFDRAGPLNTK
jgi:hypothetical protein